jgi:hypothetical protein
MEKYWLDIQGSIQVDVDHDEFLDQFYQWLESKGWSFGGSTEPSKEEVK